MPFPPARQSDPTLFTSPSRSYVSTPILFINVARTFLAERSKINNGVLTPGSALLRTTLLDRLNKEGKVTFSVVSS